MTEAVVPDRVASTARGLAGRLVVAALARQAGPGTEGRRGWDASGQDQLAPDPGGLDETWHAAREHNERESLGEIGLGNPIRIGGRDLPGERVPGSAAGLHRGCRQVNQPHRRSPGGLAEDAQVDLARLDARQMREPVSIDEAEGLKPDRDGRNGEDDLDLAVGATCLLELRDVMGG